MEAKLECRCPEYHLRDLALVLHQGDVAWISLEKAAFSKDLAVAKSSGAVVVAYERRCHLSRLPPPPTYTTGRVAVVRPTSQPAPPPPSPAVATPAPQPSIDPEALEAAVARGVSKAVEALLASGVLVPAGYSPQGPTPVAGRMSPLMSAIEIDEPVFIPSNLVPSESTATINVASEQSEVGGLDEAAAALRASRRKKESS